MESFNKFLILMFLNILYMHMYTVAIFKNNKIRENNTHTHTHTNDQQFTFST